MRQIEYKLNMPGRYDITNGFGIDDPNDTEKYEAFGLPGIRMTVDKSNDIESFFSCFSPVDSYSDFDESDWHANWQKALRGESDAWRLVAIHVRHGYMQMDFLNKGLYDVCQQMGRDGYEDDVRPEYHGKAAWCIRNSAGKDIRPYAYLRFELPGDGAVPETYLVCLSSCSVTTVTEFEGQKKRVFTFNENTPSGQVGTVSVLEIMGSGFTMCQ